MSTDPLHDRIKFSKAGMFYNKKNLVRQEKKDNCFMDDFRRKSLLRSTRFLKNPSMDVKMLLKQTKLISEEKSNEQYTVSSVSSSEDELDLSRLDLPKTPQIRMVESKKRLSLL